MNSIRFKRKQRKDFFLRFVFFASLLYFCFIFLSTNVFSWTPPTANPTANDLPRPLHTGSTAQTKTGDLFFSGGTRYIGTSSNNDFRIRTNALDRLTILSGGNVGIGTTAPGAKLEIFQGMSNYGTSFTSPHLKLMTSNTVDNTGFVGIIYSASTSANYGWSTGALRSTNGLSSFVWKHHNNSEVGVEYMRITSDGMLTTNGGITNNHVTLATRMATTSSAATQIPVFIADPASTTRTLVTRTPAQVLSDIGAAASSHTHGSYTNSTALTGANVYSLVTTSNGIVTGLTSRALTAANIGAAATTHTHTIAWTNGTTAGPTLSVQGGTAVAVPSASATVSGIVTTGSQIFAGSKTLSSKIHEFGASSDWDTSGSQTMVRMQGHGQFWIGAGNSSWYTTPTSSNHDLLITTMNNSGGAIRGITFAAATDSSGTAGYRLGRWLSGTSSATSNLIVDGTITATGITVNGIYTSSSTSSRDKIRVWNSGTYAIGMRNSMTYGAINNDYAMTFQMSNTANRGFWWGDSTHTDAQGAMSLSTNGKLTVAHSARIGYGESDTTVPGISYPLDVSGSIYSSGNHYIRNTSPTIYLLDTDHRSGMIHVNSNLFYILRGSGVDSISWESTGGGWPLVINLDNNHATFGGNVTASAFYYTSDIRLKENIKPLENSLEKILKLDAISYRLKGSEDQKLGFSAQEVQKLFPELVSENDEGFLSIDATGFTAPLLESIKTQQSQMHILLRLLKEQQKENAELKDRVEVLEEHLLKNL